MNTFWKYISIKYGVKDACKWLKDLATKYTKEDLNGTDLYS